MENNDQRFDQLIEQAIGHQKHSEQMNIRIMETVKRSARRRRVKMWLRMVAFALFVPLTAIGFAACILTTKDALEAAIGGLYIVPVVLVAIVGIATEIRLVKDFSPLDV